MLHFGFVHLKCAQNFPKHLRFLPPATHTHVYILKLETKNVFNIFSICFVICFQLASVYMSTYCKLGQAEAFARRYSVKKVFLEISQNSQESTCVKVSFLITSPLLFVKKVCWFCYIYCNLKFNFLKEFSNERIGQRHWWS